MNRLVAILLLLLVSLPSMAQKMQLSDPLYLATTLVDDISIDRMMETCRNYSLVEQDSEDGFIVFSDEKGNRLRLKMDENSKVCTPIIEVISKTKPKEIIRILTDSGYKKSTSTTYTKGNQFTQISYQCTLSKGKIILTKIRK